MQELLVGCCHPPPDHTTTPRRPSALQEWAVRTLQRGKEGYPGRLPAVLRAMKELREAHRFFTYLHGLGKVGHGALAAAALAATAVMRCVDTPAGCCAWPPAQTLELCGTMLCPPDLDMCLAHTPPWLTPQLAPAARRPRASTPRS